MATVNNMSKNLKVNPKNHNKNDQNLDGIQTDFWSILAPTWGVGGVRRIRFSLLFLLLVPSWSQDDPKTLPDPAESDFGRYLIDI